MARNFREKNKFLYDVQHESASYFMDRMIKLLDEEDDHYIPDMTKFKTSDGKIDTEKWFASPEYAAFKRDQEMLAAKGDARAAELFNSDGTVRTPMTAREWDERRAQMDLTDSQKISNLEGESWWGKLSRAWDENPSLRYGSYGALAAAGLVGAYYLYKKWQEKGSVDENDKAVAAKLDAENEK